MNMYFIDLPNNNNNKRLYPNSFFTYLITRRKAYIPNSVCQLYASFFLFCMWRTKSCVKWAKNMYFLKCLNPRL